MEQVSFNFTAAVTVCSDFGTQENKVCYCFHCFPIYLPWSDGTGCYDHSFLNVEFQASFFTLLFHLHQEALFSSFLLLLLLLSHFSHVWLCDPIDGGPLGSSVPGILQARTLEWVAISFSMHESEKWKLSHSVLSYSSQPHWLQATRLLHPWDFPGKSTVVGCQCLLLSH